jgi:hypothetical protein
MVLFGAPIAHGDHARRALLAALGLQQRLRDPSGEAATLREVRVRMGVHTGMVVVGKIGDNLRMDYTAVGNTTNLAARLQSLAEPGAIRISEATYRAALPYFEFRALGKHALKGIAEPVEVYDVRTVRSAGDGDRHTAPTGISSPLVGRDRELSSLSVSLDTLLQGRGGVVIVQGEPGMGKSRLIAEARRRSDSERVLWLEGRALSFGRHLSYWPFIEILKCCCGIEDNDAEAQAWRKLEQAARQLHPFGEFQDRLAGLDMHEFKEQVQKVAFGDTGLLDAGRDRWRKSTCCCRCSSPAFPAPQLPMQQVRARSSSRRRPGKDTICRSRSRSPQCRPCSRSSFHPRY